MPAELGPEREFQECFERPAEGMLSYLERSEVPFLPQICVLP